jgi:hypothetical protein
MTCPQVGTGAFKKDDFGEACSWCDEGRAHRMTVSLHTDTEKGKTGENMMSTWVLYSAFIGALMANTPTFNSPSACDLYRHVVLTDSVVIAFQVTCVEQPQLLCHGKKCE